MSAFQRWVAALEVRHLDQLEFHEVSRALRALSATYVERRARLARGSALATAGKRAAFALFYGPLHYLLIRQIVSTLPGASSYRGAIVDLGCGTGASGAAWAEVCGTESSVIGIDRHPWARNEAAWTYRQFGVRARTIRGNIGDPLAPTGHGAPLVAFAANEIDDAGRARLLQELLKGRGASHPVLVVEPLAGSAAPWWGHWRARFESAGGRADEWRLRAILPDIVAKLDRAAGLDHRELTGRSLWLPARSPVARPKAGTRPPE